MSFSENKGKVYENLIRAVFLEIYGSLDEDDGNQDEEYCQMLDWWSEEELPPKVKLLHSPERRQWIKVAAQQWKDYQLTVSTPEEDT